jgi:sulfur carrier protein ThiS
MKIRVQYKGQLRTLLNCSEEEIELPDGGTVASLLNSLSQHHAGTTAQPLLIVSGRAPTSLLIVVNEAAIPAQQFSTAILRAGDVVTLLPPIAGG